MYTIISIEFYIAPITKNNDDVAIDHFIKLIKKQFLNFISMNKKFSNHEIVNKGPIIWHLICLVKLRSIHLLQSGESEDSLQGGYSRGLSAPLKNYRAQTHSQIYFNQSLNKHIITHTAVYCKRIWHVQYLGEYVFTTS